MSFKFFGEQCAHFLIAMLPRQLLHILEGEKDNWIAALMGHDFWMIGHGKTIKEVPIGNIHLFKKIAQHGKVECFAKAAGTWKQCDANFGVDKFLDEEALVYKEVIVFSYFFKITNADWQWFFY